MEHRLRNGKWVRQGLTLAEITVVLGILGILALIVVPGASGWSARAREATLRQQLSVLRDTLDKFYADQKRYPERLDELTEKGYLRALPVDPFTGSADSWESRESEPGRADIYDLHSGSDALSLAGEAVSSW